MIEPQGTEEMCDPTDETKVSRLRRAVFAYSTTFFCLFCSASFVFLKREGLLAERVATGLLSFAELMSMLYLGAGVLDRARLLDKIGESFSRRTVVYQPLPKDPATPTEPGEVK